MNRRRTAVRVHVIHPKTCHFHDLQDSILLILSWVLSFSDISIKIEDSDDEWHHTIEEAAAFQTGSQLRWLFVRILLNCHPADPLKLWDDHHLHLSDDCSHLLTTKYGIETPSNDQMESPNFDFDFHTCFGRNLQGPSFSIELERCYVDGNGVTLTGDAAKSFL